MISTTSHPAHPSTCWAPQAINSSGKIVGVGATSTGELHAFLPILRNGAAEGESLSPAEADEAVDGGRVSSLKIPAGSFNSDCAPVEPEARA